MNLVDRLHFEFNLPNNSHSDEERQRQFGPGFLVTGNFNIGRGVLKICEGEDRGNSPGYMNLLFPLSLSLFLDLFIGSLGESILA